MQNDITGKFYKRGKDYTCSLVLEKDSSFTFNIKVQDFNPQCEGRWQLLGRDTILLKCNEVKNILEALSTGYMAKRENKIEIINRNKLKYNQVILKRID